MHMRFDLGITTTLSNCDTCEGTIDLMKDQIFNFIINRVTDIWSHALKGINKLTVSPVNSISFPKQYLFIKEISLSLEYRQNLWKLNV